MAITIKHSKISTIPDVDNTDLVRPSDWNADHVVLGAASSGANSDITSLSGITGGIETPDYVQFDTTATPTIALGKERWNTTTGTLSFGIIDGTTEVNIGQQMYAQVVNAEAVTITKGQAVYLFQATGNKASVKLANNTGDATSAKTLGLAAQDIAAGATGFVTTQGVLDKLSTGTFNEGDTLYLGATAGSITNVKPKAPNHLVYIGIVERANNGNGQIYVRVQNGYELDEIHDVQINSPTTGQTIVYDGTTSLWKNSNAPTIIGGSINNTPIGASTANTGAFTTLSASGVATFSAGTVSAPAITTTGDTNTGIFFPAADTIAFTEGGVESMRIDSSGNVGINTSSPFADAGYNSIDIRGSTGGQINLGTTSTRIGQLSVDATNGITLNTVTSTPIRFFAQGTERMRITSAGNVGIGTTTPTNIGAGWTALAVNNTTAGVIEWQVNSARTAQAYATSSSFFITSFSSIPLIFGTGNAERMRLDSSGNLGLGVTPSAWGTGNNMKVMDVSSFGTFGSDNAATFMTRNGFYNGSNWIYKTTAAANHFASTGSTFVWFTAPSGTAGNTITFTQAMTLTAEGRLFIGTTTGVGNELVSIRFNSSSSFPQGLNMVDANASASGGVFQVFRKSDDTYLGNIRRNSTDNAIYMGGNSYLALGSGDTERMRIDSSGNVLIGTTTNTNSSRLVVNGTISETVSSVQYLAASQFDVGTAPNKIPLNQYLGQLAYQNDVYSALDIGTGITTGTGTICRANGGLQGGVYTAQIIIDLTGLNSGGAAGDIIGLNGTALPCYIARLPNMTVLGGRMTCLETPAGGDTDIDLYSATEGTGVEDQAITALTETEIINAGAQTRGTVTYFSADPAANTYLYLVGQGTANATYTAGRFLIEIYGVQ